MTGGAVLTGSDMGYDEARRLWNGMIDRRPSVIVRPASIKDVMQYVRFARTEGIPVSVKGGGHSVTGKSVANGVMTIDLSLMREIHVDPKRKKAVAQGGSLWKDFDRETANYGLATTGGVISSTGVCGLTLGGGIGWLMGKHGLSCDNVLSADLVDAAGASLSVNATQNEDLFWAIRGGGGNFGIVTALEFQLHDVPSVHGGLLLYPRGVALDLLRRYRDVTLDAPDELTAYAALMVGHGNPMAGIAFCYSGGTEDGPAACGRFRLPSPPVADLTGDRKYPELQTMLDSTAPAGAHYYFKCPFLRELSDEAIHLIIDFAERIPSDQTQVIIEHMHGAASRVPVSQTAFGLRRVHYSINVMPSWNNPVIAEKCIDWAQEFSAALAGLGATDAYVNYLGDEGPAAVKASYGANYERLAALKRRYDPDNFFCQNQNISPINQLPASL
jgi:FAD/FMN-containing dehydrogenase